MKAAVAAGLVLLTPWLLAAAAIVYHSARAATGPDLPARHASWSTAGRRGARADWGAAMRAELASIDDPRERRRFAPRLRVGRRTHRMGSRTAAGRCWVSSPRRTSHLHRLKADARRSPHRPPRRRPRRRTTASVRRSSTDRRPPSTLLPDRPRVRSRRTPHLSPGHPHGRHPRIHSLVRRSRRLAPGRRLPRLRHPQRPGPPYRTRWAASRSSSSSSPSPGPSSAPTSAAISRRASPARAVESLRLRVRGDGGTGEPMITGCGSREVTLACG